MSPFDILSRAREHFNRKRLYERFLQRPDEIRVSLPLNTCVEQSIERHTACAPMRAASYADEAGHQPGLAIEMDFPSNPSVGKLVPERVSKRVVSKVGISQQIPKKSAKGGFSGCVATSTLRGWLGPDNV